MEISIFLIIGDYLIKWDYILIRYAIKPFSKIISKETYLEFMFLVMRDYIETYVVLSTKYIKIVIE